MLKNDVRQQVYIRNIVRDMKNKFAFILTRLTRTNISLLMQGLNSQFWVFTAALPIELLSEQELKASVIQFKFKNYIRTN